MSLSRRIKCLCEFVGGVNVVGTKHNGHIVSSQTFPDCALGVQQNKLIRRSASAAGLNADSKRAKRNC